MFRPVCLLLWLISLPWGGQQGPEVSIPERSGPREITGHLICGDRENCLAIVVYEAAGDAFLALVPAMQLLYKLLANEPDNSLVLQMAIVHVDTSSGPPADSCSY